MRTLLLLAILLSSITASAQPARPAPGNRPPRVDKREKIKQRVRALRAYTLTEQLDLDEATAAKLFPALAKFDDEFDKLLAARADLQRRLEGAGSLQDPKQVDKLVDEAVANQKALWTTEEARLAQLRKILTPAQTARVLVVLPAMERKIQNQLKRAAQKPTGRGAPPASEDELGSNPFSKGPKGAPVDPYGKGSRGNVDPFANGPSRGSAAPRKQNRPCDPFGDLHGCAK
jgi:hypothetical protein